MKLGIVADIHGNAVALEAVLTAIEREGIDQLICCGDMVGYYYSLDRCLALLERWDAWYVKGNHEDMLADVSADPAVGDRIRMKYGSGIDVALAVLTPAQVEWLITLPDVARREDGDRKILIAHGSPWDKDLYLYPDAPEDVVARCAEQGADFVLLGHTHYPFARKVSDTLILNPGSVGQARGAGRGVAQWAILDTATGNHSPRVTEYDASTVAAEARRRDPTNAYLWEILQRARTT